MMKLMKQAGKLKKAQKKINKQTIVNKSNGATLVLTGGGKVKSFQISEQLYEQGKDAVESAATEVIKGVLKKQQDIQKNMAKEALGGMNLPGM
ncbi:MAG: hypothetical protein PF545_03400 [Elusimicrobia bacterium]|nr:hypothetical protein [Elusimicrobiota bacterium]